MQFAQVIQELWQTYYITCLHIFKWMDVLAWIILVSSYNTCQYVYIRIGISPFLYAFCENLKKN